MNQTFDIHRFVLMLRLEIAEKGRNYLLMAGVMLFTLLALMVPITLSHEYNNFRAIMHFAALFMVVLFGGSLYTSGAFAQYSQQSSGIAALMVPASRIEKYLSSLLLNLAFVIPFLAFFWQFHYWATDYANSVIPRSPDEYKYIPRDFFDYTVCSYFIIQAAVFLGSIYFKKYAYIKTAVAVILFTTLLSYFNYDLGNRLGDKPNKITAFPLSGWKMWFYPEMGQPRPRYIVGYYHVTHSEVMSYAVQGFAIWLAVMLWICAYYQMKEREI
ncbi:hypothetical protein GCM10010967_12430 [Dyadobacter beijingensis]|uniref:ABC-2 type transport system permease protein n=1 Tax=Dyadobacter beijingensis TaxID=365489 RepID=A0ABQ2HLN9_9BACT|nr:hypothetical protein [Dyadobacter beijingensis]GGM82293.1 hypothetical protein GCM10010967_12430 [Dyadobacter beijingensis]